jgi:hypothetical protein
VAEGTSLENWGWVKLSVGSNPTLSAISPASNNEAYPTTDTLNLKPESRLLSGSLLVYSRTDSSRFVLGTFRLQHTQMISP